MERISSRWWSFGRLSSLGHGRWPWLLALATILSAPPADARLLQIIHTNDLHSFMEEADEPGHGGYAAVKATIEEAKREAKDRGIESIVLDSGDFSEGTPLFFADNGKQSWRVMDAMGYDAVVLGNHDWLVGPEQMNQITSSTNPKTPFLAANVTISKSYPHLRKTLKPYIEINRGGLKIAILGLTTDELVYRWRIKGGGVDLPVTTAWKHLPALRARNDLVIVLSHLGTPAELDLASKTSGVDLIVGGHSHTRLEAPVTAKDLLKRTVPVVQAGEHGNFVGRMLVKVGADKKMEIVKYQLVPVKAESGQSPDSDEVRRLVAEARTLLEQRYSASWLYDTVGFTNIPMVRPKEAATVWGGFFMETIRRSASADVSLDVGEFHGVSQPAGVITQESLMKSYPRVFDIKQTMGWNIWKIKVPGWMLQLMLDQVVKQGLYMNTAGLTYEVNSTVSGASTKNMKVQGRKIDWLKQYNIAVTEGIGRGALEISFLLQKLFSPRDTGTPIWTALEKRLRENGGTFAGSAAASPLGMIR